MRVLACDGIHEDGLALFRAAGWDVDVSDPIKDPAELAARLGEVDALLVRSATPVTAEALAGATKLKVIGRAGAGAADHLQLRRAGERFGRHRRRRAHQQRIDFAEPRGELGRVLDGVGNVHVPAGRAEQRQPVFMDAVAGEYAHGEFAPGRERGPAPRPGARDHRSTDAEAAA